jgi:5,10-methenyltetrahydrofolate synthetase
MIEKEILRSEWCKANSLENPEGIFLNLISLIKWDSAPTIAGYWPIAGEIDDLSFLEYCHNQGLQCSLPFVEDSGSPLKFKAWRPFDILEKGMYGIPAPSLQTSDLIPDVLLIPLLAL